ncbi:MAG: OmpH family outer membrane protein [Phycisphaerales bacterium]|nr:OmpH family outer membrane protein [Phycisphaerales bacterium]
MNQINSIGRLLIVGLICVLVVTWIGNVRSDANQAPNASKTAVAVVNLEKTFNGLEQWVAVEGTLMDMGGKLEDEAERRREVVEGLQADTEDYPVGSEKYKEAERRFEMAALEFQAYVAMHQGRRMEYNDTQIRSIYEKIKDAANKMADERGLDLILVDDSVVPIPPDSQDILSQISSRRVLFARDQMDITNALIAEMNAAYRAGGS